MLLKLAQSFSRQGIRLVNTVNLDTMAAVSNVETPVPGVADLNRLCIQTVIPAAGEDFDPAFGNDRELHMPCAPGVLVFLGHVLHRYRIPGMAAIGGTFDSFYGEKVSKLLLLVGMRLLAWPSSTATVCPAFDFDGAVVDDDLFRPW